MLGPIPDEAVLPTDPQKRTRVLLNGMILSAPSPHMRRIVVDQLEAFGPEAVSLVHNFGTRIIVLPKDMKAEEAFKKYHLDDDAAKDLKSDTGGMYLPSSNLLFLREDMLSDGFSARLSAGIARHELAHALDDALGSALDVTALYKDAKDHHHLVTSYAGTNEAEYFAESVTAYLSPEGEFKESFLRSAYIGLSGFEAPQHPLLEKRDPAAARMLDDVFNNKVPNAKAPLHRSKREQDETWLWRAHQLSPSDERIRIALLDRQKARAKDPGEAATLEGRIEAEYRHVEGRLIQTWKADPAQRKHGFALLSHYGERAERVEAGPRKANLDARAAQVVKALAKVDARAGGDSQARWNRAQDYDYLAGQLRMNGLGTASEAAREVADGMMKDSWQRR